MQQDLSLSQVIQMAVQREQDAYFFYMDLIDRMGDPSVVDTLEWIAGEEKKHRKFLVDYRNGKFGSKSLRMSSVVEYSIAEHAAAPDIEENMDSADIFLVAAHRELQSYEFYTGLAGMHTDGEIRKLLDRIANEELKHKEKMEYLYTNTAFPQTSGG